jgi:ribosome maturation factor RimP
MEERQKGLEITLRKDMEILIYSCNKLSHRFHVVLMKLDEELLNVKSMTIEYGLKEIERFLEGGQKKELAEL